jgi:hypothetical protein
MKYSTKYSKKHSKKDQSTSSVAHITSFVPGREVPKVSKLQGTYNNALWSYKVRTIL